MQYRIINHSGVIRFDEERPEKLAEFESREIAIICAETLTKDADLILTVETKLGDKIWPLEEKSPERYDERNWITEEDDIPF